MSSRRSREGQVEDPFDLCREIRQQMAAEYQWSLLVEFLGSEETAAKVMALTPQFGGLSERAKEVLDDRFE
jgi:hypothetical protein